jgi:hypothetical protein
MGHKGMKLRGRKGIEGEEGGKRTGKIGRVEIRRGEVVRGGRGIIGDGG